MIKAEAEKELIQPGSITSVSVVQANAWFSICDSFERESKVIDVSEAQWEKHDSAITSTELGK
jgi:hypothetical protein